MLVARFLCGQQLVRCGGLGERKLRLQLFNSRVFLLPYRCDGVPQLLRRIGPAERVGMSEGILGALLALGEGAPPVRCCVTTLLT
jgi:hypothetical protein